MATIKSYFLGLLNEPALILTDITVLLINLSLLKLFSNFSEISISSTSGADIRITVNATSVETNSTSGSDIRIAGTTINHASSATSGASIDAYELESKNVIVNATSGAGINIYASEKLDAKANSGGDIDFKGNPKSVNKNSSSGGDISKI